MKDTSEFSLNKKMLLVCTPIFAVAILLSWLTVLINANFVLNSNVFIKSAFDLTSRFCNVCVYAVSFAFMILAVSKKLKRIIPFGIFFALSALRYFISAIIGGVMRGAVSKEDMISAAIALATDIVIMGILFAVSYMICKKDQKSNDIETSVSRRFIPDLSNAVNKSIFIAGSVWASIQLISLVIFDIIYSVNYGAPNAANIVWMIIYYVLAMLICPAFYFISSFVVRLVSKNQDNSF